MVSVAPGSEVTLEPPAGRRPLVLLAGAPSRQPDEGAPSARWSAAVRLHLLPVSLLGPACAGLLLARAPGVRPALLAVAVLLASVGHALAALVRDLGDARPRRAGVLDRRSAGRAVLALTGLAVLLAGALAAARGPGVLLWGPAGVAVVLVGVSRRAGPLLTAAAGLATGSGTLLFTLQAVTGQVRAWAVPAAVVAGAVAAAITLERRCARPTGWLVRVLVALPLAGAGVGVATGGLPVEVLVLLVAVPVARRAAQESGAALARAARLCGVLFVGALLAAALLGHAAA